MEMETYIYTYIRMQKKEHIIDIVINSKVQRPGVCNALETLLINSQIYKDMGSLIIEKLLENEVELFVDENNKKRLSKFKSC